MVMRIAAQFISLTLLSALIWIVVLSSSLTHPTLSKQCAQPVVRAYYPGALVTQRTPSTLLTMTSTGTPVTLTLQGCNFPNVGSDPNAIVVASPTCASSATLSGYFTPLTLVTVLTANKSTYNLPATFSMYAGTAELCMRVTAASAYVVVATKLDISLYLSASPNLFVTNSGGASLTLVISGVNLSSQVMAVQFSTTQACAAPTAGVTVGAISTNAARSATTVTFTPAITPTAEQSYLCIRPDAAATFFLIDLITFCCVRRPFVLAVLFAPPT